MAKVLIIDDDPSYNEMLCETVVRMGYDVDSALTLQGGLETAAHDEFDVVFLDVRMPDGNGLEYLSRYRQGPGSPEVIILTGLGDPDGAEMAIKSGAWAYVQKGSSIKEITLPLVRALEYRREKSAGHAPLVLKRDNIIGSSAVLRANLEIMARAAQSKANVLITGETGTGKEVFARAIHENSERADGNFVVVDCAALPGTIVESVLFGHEKGAFTGADRSQSGLIAQADMGTLFLDEVGELPLEIQKRFLRVLQERHFRPVGGQREVKSDFRLVAATNRTLEDMVEAGRFRSDLLFRLRAFTLELAPIRGNHQDIRDLALHYVGMLCQRYQIGIKGMTPDFLSALYHYNWPGNVRELINVLDRAIASAQTEPTLHIKHLPHDVRIFVARSSIRRDENDPTAHDSSDTDQTLPSLNEFRYQVESKYFQDLMSICDGDVKRACQISKLSRSRLYDLLKKYGIRRNY
jgi:two-component system NtrC family response regulator